MKWNKKGLIIAPNQDIKYGTSRIMVPTPFLVNDSLLRIYCGFCDDNIVSRISYVDVNPNNPSQIIKINETPVLDIGEDGLFDDNGLCPTSVFTYNKQIYMYYFGFQKGVKIPFYMFMGLAISNDNGKTFSRVQKVPILDRTDKEPIMRSGGYVRNDNGIFKIWYPSGNSFVNVKGKLTHTYSLKYLESNDGINWGDEGLVILKPNEPDEYGFGRPYVWIENDIYKMLYSIRTFSKGYRLGYAVSNDGIHWTRQDDQINISVSNIGWDSEIICYSSLFKFKNKTYLFYNGNHLGQTGFGYAELEEE